MMHFIIMATSFGVRQGVTLCFRVSRRARGNCHVGDFRSRAILALAMPDAASRRIHHHRPLSCDPCRSRLPSPLDARFLAVLDESQFHVDDHAENLAPLPSMTRRHTRCSRKGRPSHNQHNGYHKRGKSLDGLHKRSCDHCPARANQSAHEGEGVTDGIRLSKLKYCIARSNPVRRPRARQHEPAAPGRRQAFYYYDNRVPCLNAASIRATWG